MGLSGQELPTDPQHRHVWALQEPQNFKPNLLGCFFFFKEIPNEQQRLTRPQLPAQVPVRLQPGAAQRLHVHAAAADPDPDPDPGPGPDPDPDPDPRGARGASRQAGFPDTPSSVSPAGKEQSNKKTPNNNKKKKEKRRGSNKPSQSYKSPCFRFARSATLR